MKRVRAVVFASSAMARAVDASENTHVALGKTWPNSYAFHPSPLAFRNVLLRRGSHSHNANPRQPQPGKHFHQVHFWRSFSSRTRLYPGPRHLGSARSLRKPQRYIHGPSNTVLLRGRKQHKFAGHNIHGGISICTNATAQFAFRALFCVKLGCHPC